MEIKSEDGNNNIFQKNKTGSKKSGAVENADMTYKLCEHYFLVFYKFVPPGIM